MFAFSRECLTNEFHQTIFFSLYFVSFFLTFYYFKFFIPIFFSVPDIESYPPIEAIVHQDQLQLLQLPEPDTEVQSKQHQEVSEETYSNILRFNRLEVAFKDKIFVTANTSSTVVFELSNSTNKVI